MNLVITKLKEKWVNGTFCYKVKTALSYYEVKRELIDCKVKKHLVITKLKED